MLQANIKNLIHDRNEAIKMAQNTRKLLEFHDKLVSKIMKEISSIQESCVHNFIFDYEGYHGSSKGDKYYLCTKCNKEEIR